MDGVWLHRLLKAHGIAAYVLEPTSILVNRRARRAKTDRLDAEGMLRVLATWLGGDRQVCAVWCACPHQTKRTPSARTASANTSCKTSCASRTGSRRCCSPKASGKGRHSALGSATWRGFERVTDVFYRHCCGPRSIACAAAGVFGQDKSEAAASSVDLKSLHAKIGELTLENDFLESALIEAGLLSAKR